jgi:hypothetical protein
MLKINFTVILLMYSLYSSAQTVNANWRQDLNQILEQFQQCTASPDKSACNNYTGEALNKVYKVNDFYSQQSKRFMTASEIATFLKGSSHWKSLGQPFDQKTLNAAQEHANSKKAVVAVFMNAQGVGHVAIVVPGELKPSGSWGLNVPPAASFLASDPAKSFVDKGLSFAFMKQMLKDVVIYARN